MKPPGVGAGRELDISDVPATLLDVAPTLSRVLGLETKKTFEGCPIPLPP